MILESRDVAVVDIEFTTARELHQRYRIEAVPTLVVADGEGVVVRGFVGPVTATDLWAAVAEARDPGSSPEPGLGRWHPMPPNDAPPNEVRPTEAQRVVLRLLGSSVAGRLLHDINVDRRLGGRAVPRGTGARRRRLPCRG